MIGTFFLLPLESIEYVYSYNYYNLAIFFRCQVTINEQTTSSIPASSGAADVNILNNNNSAINSTVSSYRSASNMPSSSWYSYKYNAKSDTGEEFSIARNVHQCSMPPLQVLLAS